MSDTLMRQWQMLRLIPRHPLKASTAELKQRLADEGFETTQRTIQRDLMRLSDIYPLACDEGGKPFGWSWMEKADVMDIPGMDSHTALAFWLAGEHLEPLLPKTTLHQLQPHFKTAAHVLDSIPADKGAPAWRGKVRVLHRGPTLKVPAIAADVEHQVYDALLRNHRFAITYVPRGQEGVKEYEINPLGLVLKDGISYLVCSMWDYPDIRLLALHRIQTAELLDKLSTVPLGFDLDAYIASGELDFALGGGVQLKALFSADAAFHLGERPLSDDQTIAEQDDGRMLVTATVQETSELRWWLLGFGDQVEVLEPFALRDYFAEIASNMASAYVRTE
ncbi:MAG: WYL domain-containing protein [Mariprofundaceae bacterium]|nr:WYL domain-containing protein [Mariprofundaceae bacterium]